MIAPRNRKLLQSLLLLGSVTEARDPYTGGHLWRMSQLCKMIAARSGASRRVEMEAVIGGWLHDIGKIGVPDAILLKRGRLTGDEAAVMHRHPRLGAALLRDHPLGLLARRVVAEHHERLDGTGYPRGLHGEATGPASRIVAIADAFDAMTSVRPYRAAMTPEKALSSLRPLAGRHYDAGAFEALAALVEEGRLEGVVGHADHGVDLVLCPHCGPAVAVPRDARSGDVIRCHACLGVFRLYFRGKSWRAMPETDDAAAPDAAMPPGPPSAIPHIIDSLANRPARAAH